MTRFETRAQLIEELGADAERMIDQELAAITISYDGCSRRAIGVIDTVMGLRLLHPERCDVLKQQARAISQARIAQLELS